MQGRRFFGLCGSFSHAGLSLAPSLGHPVRERPLTFDCKRAPHARAARSSGPYPPSRFGLDQRTLRFSADSLPRLLTTSYWMVCPSLRVLNPARSTAEMWTNTSLPPPWGWINPYPFVGLNHFTVPVAIVSSPALCQPSERVAIEIVRVLGDDLRLANDGSLQGRPKTR